MFSSRPTARRSAHWRLWRVCLAASGSNTRRRQRHLQLPRRRQTRRHSRPSPGANEDAWPEEGRACLIAKSPERMSASLIGRLGSSAFRLSTSYSVDVAHGLVLLFGIGTKALPSWDSKTRRNNLWDGLAVSVTAGPSGHAISPHPSSREGHHSTARWSSSFLLLD